MIGEVRLKTEDEEGEISETEIDESLEESFPASDPPSWTLGHEPHRKILESKKIQAKSKNKKKGD